MPTSKLRRTSRWLALAAASRSPSPSPGRLDSRHPRGAQRPRRPYSDLAGEARWWRPRCGGGLQGAEPRCRRRVLSADHQTSRMSVPASCASGSTATTSTSCSTCRSHTVALAVHQIVREKNRLMINSGAGASEITGALCSPNTIHWTYDTWALATAPRAMVRSGGDTGSSSPPTTPSARRWSATSRRWSSATAGKVLGSVRHPVAANDFSSFLIQAQGSKAKVIGLANAGSDTINTIKQGAEFGEAEGGQRLAGLLVFLSDVHSLGLKVAQGLVLTEAFYWDLQRRHPRLVAPLRRALQGPDADHGPGRRLFRHDALPQGREGDRQQGPRHGHGRDAQGAGGGSAVRAAPRCAPTGG